MRRSDWYCIIVAILLQLGFANGAVLGLDYGYQFGKAMVVSPQAPLEIVLTAESKRKDENGVGIKKFNGRLERTYGSSVSSSMVTRFPGNSLMHLKPLLGKMREESLGEYLQMHPGLKTKVSDRGGISFVVEDQEFPVEEVAAMNIQQYVDRANELLKEKGGDDSVDCIALTIPEYYTVEQRNAFLDAVSLVPLQQSFLVNEGLCVAIDYALKQRSYESGDKKYHLVYDMGAGSTVATLVSIQQPENASEPLRVEFIGYGHTEDISGSKLTHAIANIIIAKFSEENPSIKIKQIESNARAMAKILQTAEKAKQILSVNANAHVSIESILEDTNFKTVLHRQEFEDYLDDLLSVVIDPITDAFKNQFGSIQVAMKDIDSVIITGGSTRVPIVQKKISDYLGETPISKSVNADESAVNGATMKGVQLSKSFKMKPLTIIDRTIYPYSVKAGKNDKWIELFPVGSQYPNSTSISIHPQDDKFLPFMLELYENHRLFETVEVIPDQVKSKFTSDKCPGGVVYNLTFSLSVNRLFDCTKVETVCLPMLVNNETTPQDNSTSTKASNSKLSTMRLATTSKFTHLQPYTTRQRKVAKSKLDEWNRSDMERKRLEQELNQLETILYAARNYLETETVIEKGPKSEMTKLSQLVGEYLEWLDYESDDANIFEITGRIVDISTLKGKIEMYIEAADEKLDSEKFEHLVDEGNTLLNEVNGYNKIIDEQLRTLEADFEALGLNVTEEYGKLRVPKNLDVSTSKKGDAVSGLQSLLAQVEAMLNNNSINNKDREELFELKVMFEKSIEDLKTLHRMTESAHNYRFRDLQSLYNRKLKAVLRQEKRKADEKAEASRVHNDTVLDQEEPSSEPEENNTIEHDEL